jgi:hypothetical protein
LEIPKNNSRRDLISEPTLNLKNKYLGSKIILWNILSKPEFQI